MRIVSLLIALIGLCAKADMDLMQAPLIIRGSSFAAGVKSHITITENYYNTINDGDAKTYWTPMESRGPHFLELLWNHPVEIHALSWQTEAVSAAKLSRWTGGKWVEVKQFSGEHAEFSALKSDRWRIDLTSESKPKIRELKLMGPDQYVLPKEIVAGTEPGRVEIKEISIPSRIMHPGEVATISFNVSTNAAPFGVLVELSDRAALDDLRENGSDFCSGRWVSVPDANGRISIDMELPPWTPQGTNDLLITAIAKSSNKQISVSSRILGTIRVERQNFPQMLAPVNEVRVGDNDKGQRGFIINGKWHPAFFNRYYGNPTPERLAATAKTGLQILYWQNREVFPVEGAALEKRLKWFDDRIKMALRVNPENYFILSQRAKADSSTWLAAHPKELMLLEDGRKNPENIVSFGSELYLRQSEEFVTKLVEFVSKQPYAGRVIGYHLWTCTKNDGFQGGARPNRTERNRDKFIFGDYNPGALKLFREFLRAKYGNDVAALRKAWLDNNVSFKNAIVHSHEVVKEDYKESVFRDPVKSRPAIDYIEFFPSMLSRYFRRTAAAIKKASNGKAIVLVHYGAVKHYLCYSWVEQLQSNNNDLESFMDDPNIDVFVQAQPYNLREAGNAMHTYQPVKSIDLHGKLFMYDHDHRTLGSGVLKYGRHRGQYEGAAIYERDYSHQWIENSGAWISDMSLSPWGKFDEYRLPWYTMPEVIRPIHDTIEVMNKVKTPRKHTTEIAVVLSLNSPRYEDACRANPHYKTLVNDLLLHDGFPFLGAPHDVILSGDLCRGNLPNYKLFVFLNPTYFTPAERRAIDGLKRDGKVLAWFYAPGYATDNGLSLSAAEKVSGFRLKLKQKAEIPSLVFKGRSKLAEGLIGQKLAAQTWGGLDYISPPSFSPVFYTDDVAVEAAGIDAEGKVVYGAKDFGDWKSVWCGVPNFNLAALENLCRFAGVHLYVKSPVVMNVDNRMMMLHNGYESARSLHITLPKAAKVIDLKTGQPIAEGKEFDITLEAPETKLLGLVWLSDI